VGNVTASLVDLALELSDVLVDADAFLALVGDRLLIDIDVALKSNYLLALLSETVLVLALALTHLTLEPLDAALKVSHDALKKLVLSFPRLVALDFISVGSDDTVSCIRNVLGLCCFRRAVESISVDVTLAHVGIFFSRLARASDWLHVPRSGHLRRVCLIASGPA